MTFIFYLIKPMEGSHINTYLLNVSFFGLVKAAGQLTFAFFFYIWSTATSKEFHEFIPCGG